MLVFVFKQSYGREESIDTRTYFSQRSVIPEMGVLSPQHHYQTQPQPPALGNVKETNEVQENKSNADKRKKKTEIIKIEKKTKTHPQNFYGYSRQHSLAPQHGFPPAQGALAPAQHALPPAQRALAPAQRALAPAQHALAPAQHALTQPMYGHALGTHNGLLPNYSHAFAARMYSMHAKQTPFFFKKLKNIFSKIKNEMAVMC